jgi:hypothetical protein
MDDVEKRVANGLVSKRFADDITGYQVEDEWALYRVTECDADGNAVAEFVETRAMSIEDKRSAARVREGMRAPDGFAFIPSEAIDNAG